MIRRAFAMSGLEVLTTSELLDWTHARRRLERRTLPLGLYSRTHRTAAQVAERVGHGLGPGRPWLWRLKDSQK
jgi:hypothetical protein